MIKPEWGSRTGSFLTLRGFDVHFKLYDCVGHEIGVKQVID